MFGASKKTPRNAQNRSINKGKIVKNSTKEISKRIDNKKPLDL